MCYHRQLFPNVNSVTDNNRSRNKTKTSRVVYVSRTLYSQQIRDVDPLLVERSASVADPSSSSGSTFIIRDIHGFSFSEEIYIIISREINILQTMYVNIEPPLRDPSHLRSNILKLFSCWSRLLSFLFCFTCLSKHWYCVFKHRDLQRIDLKLNKYG